MANANISIMCAHGGSFPFSFSFSVFWRQFLVAVFPTCYKCILGMVRIGELKYPPPRQRKKQCHLESAAVYIVHVIAVRLIGIRRFSICLLCIANEFRRTSEINKKNIYGNNTNARTDLGQVPLHRSTAVKHPKYRTICSYHKNEHF